MCNRRDCGVLCPLITILTLPTMKIWFASMCPVHPVLQRRRMWIGAPAGNWRKMWACRVSLGRWERFTGVDGPNKRYIRNLNKDWFYSYLLVQVWGVYKNIVTRTACVGNRIKGFLDRGIKNRLFDIFVGGVQVDRLPLFIVQSGLSKKGGFTPQLLTLQAIFICNEFRENEVQHTIKCMIFNISKSLTSITYAYVEDILCYLRHCKYTDERISCFKLLNHLILAPIFQGGTPSNAIIDRQ